ncbi:MAG: hypothetical protein JOZ69_13135 [Myxococcales bacterium]|nr:hypothetical protein [Myxococcales bacterium]
MNPTKFQLPPVLPFLLAIAPLAGCTHGQGEVDVSSTNVASFPVAPAALQAQANASGDVTTEASIVLDLKDELASLGDLGSLSAEVSKNSLSGAGLGFIHHIRATLETADGALPETLATEADVPPATAELDLPLAVSSAALLRYLTEGKAVLHFYVTGQMPDRPFTLTHTLIAHVNVAVHRSVL